MRKSRERSRGEIISQTSVTTSLYDNNGTQYFTKSKISGNQVTGQYEYMSDVVGSKFKTKSSRGGIVNNGMHQFKETREATATQLVLREDVALPMEHRYVYDGGHFLLQPSSGIGFGQVVHPPNDIDFNQLIKLAGTSAQAGIQNPVFQGTVFLAELRETMKFLRNPLDSIGKLLRRADKRSKRLMRADRRRLSHFDRTLRGKIESSRAYNLGNFVADTHLAYRYGFTPLAHDVNNIISAITNYNVPVDRKTSRGYAENASFYNETLEDDSTHGLFRKDVTSVHTVQVRAGILYRFSFSDTFGVRMEQIPSAAWEAVPFSFVGDWLFNLNDWIAAVTPKAGTDILSSWTTVTDTNTTEGFGSVSQPTSSSTRSVEIPSTSDELYVTVNKTRTPGHKIGIALHPLPFKGDLGIKRVADSIALLIGLASKRPRIYRQ